MKFIPIQNICLSISKILFTSYLNQFCCNLINTWQSVFLHLLLYFRMPNWSLTPCTLSYWHTSTHTMGICKQITLLITYKPNSWSVSILNFILQHSHSVSFRFINFTLQIFPLAEMFSLVQIMFAFICLGSCNHCNSACFWAKIFSIHHQIMVYAPSVHISLAILVEILISCPYYPSFPKLHPCLKFYADTVPQTAPSLGSWDWMNLSMSDISAGHFLTDKPLPKFCNHQIVTSTTLASYERLDTNMLEWHPRSIENWPIWLSVSHHKSKSV
jgi:hypothetical protein